VQTVDLYQLDEDFLRTVISSILAMSVSRNLVHSGLAGVWVAWRRLPALSSMTLWCAMAAWASERCWAAWVKASAAADIAWVVIVTLSAGSRSWS